jgi:beta-glucosidase
MVYCCLFNQGSFWCRIGWEKDNVPAIIEAFYPGAVGGQAVADVLFGDYNPGGRMPVTTVTSEKDLPIVQDYNMSTPPGRTYKYYTGNLVFPFGYGLSYTMFQYNSLMLADTSIQACANLSLSFTVKNTGSMDGDEVSQVYLVAPREGIDYPVPIRTLAGFDRVHIAAGQSMILKFILDPYE